VLTTRLGRNQAVRIEAFCLFNQVFHANANGVLQFGQDHLFPNPLTVTTHQAPKHRLYIIGYSDTIPKEITKKSDFSLISQYALLRLLSADVPNKTFRVAKTTYIPSNRNASVN